MELRDHLIARHTALRVFPDQVHLLRLRQTEASPPVPDGRFLDLHQLRDGLDPDFIDPFFQRQRTRIIGAQFLSFHDSQTPVDFSVAFLILLN